MLATVLISVSVLVCDHVPVPDTVADSVSIPDTFIYIVVHTVSDAAPVPDAIFAPYPICCTPADNVVDTVLDTDIVYNTVLCSPTVLLYSS